MWRVGGKGGVGREGWGGAEGGAGCNGTYMVRSMHARKHPPGHERVPCRAQGRAMCGGPVCIKRPLRPCVAFTQACSAAPTRLNLPSGCSSCNAGPGRCSECVTGYIKVNGVCKPNPVREGASSGSPALVCVCRRNTAEATTAGGCTCSSLSRQGMFTQY